MNTAKVVAAKCKAIAAFKCDSFLLNAFVSLVKRRIAIRIVRFWPRQTI